MISSSGSRVHESGLQLESLSHHNYNNNSQLNTNVSSNNMMLHSPMKSLEPSALARGFTHLPTLTQFTDTISQVSKLFINFFFSDQSFNFSSFVPF